MLKLTLTATILLAFLVATVIAAPLEVKRIGPEIKPFGSSKGEEIPIDEGAAKQDDHLRFRRLTCDTGTVGDTLCAADCLTQGKASGSCIIGICVCSSKTISEAVFG